MIHEQGTYRQYYGLASSFHYLRVRRQCDRPVLTRPERSEDQRHGVISYSERIGRSGSIRSLYYLQRTVALLLDSIDEVLLAD